MRKPRIQILVLICIADTLPALAAAPQSQPAATTQPAAATQPATPPASSRPAATTQPAAAAPATRPALAATRPAEAPVVLAHLAIYPPAIRLEHRADLQRIVIVGTYSNGETRDLTATAKLTFAPEPLAIYENGRLRPTKNGECTLTAVADGRAMSAKLLVRGVEADRPVSFRHDVVPVFMKAGCSTGACHGSAAGKNGFRLSLFGFEPEKDYISLTRDYDSRRIDLADPHRSLMLRKPLAEVEHGGGERLKSNSELTAILTRWLQANVPDDPKNLTTLTGIAIMPNECVLRGPNKTQQLIVQASYSDGTDRDVTSLAVIDATDKTTAPVNDAGLVTSGLKGEAFVMARFGTFAVVSQFIVLSEGEPFVWRDDDNRAASASERSTQPAAAGLPLSQSPPLPLSARAPAPNFIDEAINAKLQKLQINPSGICTDETFLRRAYLDTIGLPPTVDEYKQFMADASPDKRAKLIDALLARREFPELWALKWADLLKIESESRRISHKAMFLYSTWLRDQILSSKPLDQMVRAMLGAEGGNFRTPQANFYMTETSPTQMAENVAQVFCGIRIQCAQCHNHPFERWTQDDYYSFAAFFAQVGRKGAEDPRELILFNAGGGEVQHLRTGANMAPKFLGGATPTIPPGTDRRKLLADWLTSKDNPYFAACFVDRVWAHFMGRGLVDPPDDVRVSNPPSHPALRELLAKKFVESNYDLRALVRSICNSRAYQRTSQTIPSNEKDTRNFSHASVRRLSAETLLDAVCQVTQAPEKFNGLPLGARAVQVADARSGSFFLDIFGRPPRNTVCTCERQCNPTLTQALHLINGQTLGSKIGAETGRLIRLMKANTPPEAMIDDLYVAAYTRRPTDPEKAVLLKTVAEAPDKRAVLEDIYWAVLNSKEFVFNH